MRLILFFFLFSFALSAQNNIIKTVGISYTNGTPTYTPAKAGSALALDTVAWRYYTWNGSSWLSDGFRVQTISGCSAPGYTPTKFQSHLVINACTVMQGGPELYYWNGSAWLCLNCDAGSGIDTLSSYTALRAYTGTSLAVYVQTFTYTFNSVSYTTLGGLFRRVATGTENGGTLIAASNGVKWARDWDGVNTYPEWWQVGGCDWDGTCSPSTTTTNGVYNNADRAIAAHRVAGVGGVVNYGSSVKQYDVDMKIEVLKDQTVYGNQVIFKRANSPFPTTTSSTNGTTSFTVTSVDGFRVGQKILVLNQLLPNGGLSWDESSRESTITNISGLTITINAPFNQSNMAVPCPIGSRVMRSNYIFYHTGSANNGYVKFERFSVDGNRLNGGAAQRFNSAWWHSNWSIDIGYNSPFTTVENCNFYNTPSENMVFNNGLIIGCTGNLMDGSFIHSTTSPAGDINDIGIAVIDCRIDSATLAGNNITDHSEAVIVNSVHSSNWKITNNHFTNIKEGIIIIGPEDPSPSESRTIFTGNYAENCGAIVTCLNLSGVADEEEEWLTIHGNTFDRCGDITLMGENIFEGLGVSGVNISNNNFFDTRVYLENCSYVNISNNDFRFKDDRHNSFASGYVNKYYPTLILNRFSHFQFVNCKSVSIDNNRLENFITKNDTTQMAINIAIAASSTLRKNSVGANEDVYYMQDIQVSNNKIYGYQYGISCSQNAGGNITALGDLYTTLGWNISGNTIVLAIDTLTTASVYTFGISVIPGVICQNNLVQKQSSRHKELCLIAWGLEGSTGFDALSLKYLGPTIANNRFLSNSPNNMCMLLGIANNSNANIMAYDNDILGMVITDPTFASRSYLATPRIINSAMLPKLTNYTPVRYQHFQQNKTQY